MKNFVLAILAVLCMAHTALAQQMTIATYTPHGVTGNIVHNGDGVGTATLTLTRVDIDLVTGQMAPNPTTAKKFGPCAGGQVTNCVMATGKYFIKDLPLALDGFGPWREIDVRAEAKGLAHYITDPVRVSTNGRNVAQAPIVNMYRVPFRTFDMNMWWENDNTIAIGFWAKQEGWSEEVMVDFAFKGSSWTKAQTDYGTMYAVETVGTKWQWVEYWFWAPTGTGIANFGGSLCGTVTVRGLHDAGDVKETFPQVCLTLKPEPVAKGLIAK